MPIKLTFILAAIGFLLGWSLSMIKIPYNDRLDRYRKIIAGSLMIVSIPLLLFTFSEFIKD